MYYLFICVLQCIGPISISGGQPTNAPPLLFLMMVSMVKDFFEDNRRRTADNQENNKIATIIETPIQTDTLNNSLQAPLVRKVQDKNVAWKDI